MVFAFDSRRPKSTGLDGLRALAVVAVVWHHTHSGYDNLPISHNGFLGVDVFFVLSGFLITTLLLSELTPTGSISLKNFYMRRSLDACDHIVLVDLRSNFISSGRH